MKSTNQESCAEQRAVRWKVPACGRTPAGAVIASKHRLNITAIEASLASVQREFPRINAVLTSRRDPLTDEVVANMVAGYRQVDDCLAQGIDLFRMGKSAHLLELNRIVLCGDTGRRQDFMPHGNSGSPSSTFTRLMVAVCRR